MDRWIALLRGINVGGHNKVPMPALRKLAEGLGWQGVKSYIASGNLVFEAPEEDHAARLRAAMREEMGVEVAVLVLSASELREALEQCPWDPEDGRHAHLFFCFGDPEVDEERLDQLRKESEELVAVERTVYLLAPEGIGRSKLVERLGSVVRGTEVTGRNLRTVRTLAEMLAA